MAGCFDPPAPGSVAVRAPPSPATRNVTEEFEHRMDMLSLILIAVALSMDAFAVAVSSGMCCTKPGRGCVVKLAGFFGFFQFFMPVVGYFLGKSVYGFIESVDHWIAFALLAFIGAKMIIETVREAREEQETGVACTSKDPFRTKTLFVMAIATSIDALAVGITFALTDEPIWLSAGIIGAVTFVLSGLGVLLGNRVGTVLKKGAAILGGAILIGIGLKILIEHLTLA